MSPRPLRLRYILIALVGAGALACAYLVGRQSTQAAAAVAAERTPDRDRAKAGGARTGPIPSLAMALPARDGPLRKALPVLRARAAAGDVTAATRLYRDLRACGNLAGLEWSFGRADDALLNEKIGAADRQTIEDYRVQLDAVESRKQVMLKFHALCDGLDRSALDAQLASLRRAAQLGDEDARACYLKQGPGYDSQGLIRHPEWIAAYRDSVAPFIQAGLADGDWKTVDILRDAYRPGSDSALAGVLGSDPAAYYRYLKLYRLGAQPFRFAQIDPQLVAAAARLDPEQRADADLWAQTRFQRDFRPNDSVTSTAEGWDPCSFAFDPL